MQFLNKNYCVLRSIKYGNIYVTKLNFLQQINGKERLLSVFYCTFNLSRVFYDFLDAQIYSLNYVSFTFTIKFYQ